MTYMTEQEAFARSVRQLGRVPRFGRAIRRAEAVGLPTYFWRAALPDAAPWDAPAARERHSQVMPGDTYEAHYGLDE